MAQQLTYIDKNWAEITINAHIITKVPGGYKIENELGHNGWACEFLDDEDINHSYPIEGKPEQKWFCFT